MYSGVHFGLRVQPIIGILRHAPWQSTDEIWPEILMTTNTDKIEFRASDIHGTGVFALARIPANATILEYRGECISKAESLVRCEANNPYIFSIDDQRDLDGNFEWNPARLINHSCSPNCAAEIDDGRIWIRTLRVIKPGAEISFNYGYDYSDYREHPCRCGVKECVGYMVAEEFFPQLRSMAAALKED